MKFLLHYLLVFLLSSIPQLMTSSSYSYNKSCLHDQSSALLQFKASLSTYEFAYPPQTKLLSWNADTDCCTSWEGVACDAFGFVIGLDVSYHELYGSIDSNTSLFHLHHLETLNLAGNYFNLSSNVPTAFAYNLHSLITLDLSKLWLQLSSPAALTTLLTNFSSLRELHLDHSLNLSMRPAEEWIAAIAQLHNLQVLSMSFCQLSGSFGVSLLNHSSLSHIDLSYNFITNFPQEMFHLPNLQILDLYSNAHLTSSLPEFPRRSTIQELILSDTQFSGSIPHSIENLSMLAELEANGCNLSGAIPNSIGNVTQLMFLELSGNDFGGEIPLSFSNLSHLVNLDLSHNNLLGPLPLFKSSSQTITLVDLSFNHFTGSIPCYANNELSNLMSLKLSNNLLTGPIPSSLFNMPYLGILALDGNKLSGELDIEGFPNSSNSSRLLDIYLNDNMLEGQIPSSISMLSNLEMLDLNSNNFHGVVDPRIFNNLNHLRSIDLSNNSKLSIDTNAAINVTIRNLNRFIFSSCNLSRFPSFLRYQWGLWGLDLSNNQLQGEMPEWIWNTAIGRLNLSRNSLVDFEDRLSNHSSSTLKTLDLSSNHFKTSLPTLPPTLSYMLFSNNNFIGQIPLTMCNASFIFVDLSNNQLSGTIPSCFISLSTLRALNLSKNKLQGRIPNNFRDNYCGLRGLNLNGNHLEGSLPRSLVTCTDLQVLDLGNNQINDTFPIWLETLQKLQVLMLQSNRFHGSIAHHPQLDDSFPLLHIVDLSSNSFTGHLPLKYFWSSYAMGTSHNHGPMSLLILEDSSYRFPLVVLNKGEELEYGLQLMIILNVIDLSSNQFEGEISELVGDFKSLVVLNLSRNFLTGKIPSSLGNLTELQSLDLSNNDLSGEIPSELTSLTFLSVLNLSFNLLVGRIPSGGQFNTFASNSFEGNLGLCGFPLQSTMCNPMRTNDSAISERPHNQEDSNGNFVWMFAVAGVVSGLIIGMVVEHFILTRNMRYLAQVMKVERFIQAKFFPKTRYHRR